MPKVETDVTAISAAADPSFREKPTRERRGLALCLSGGGFRATLFHCGALRRLNELGVLSQVATVSSVSGGSIANGMLAMQWAELKKSEKDGVFNEFDALYRKPLHDFCRRDLRTHVLFWDRANPLNWIKLASSDYSVTDKLCDAYGRDLKMSVPLSSLPAAPQFIFCATNLETGACWRFATGPSGRMGDYYTGWAETGDTPLATAVAASSAFPVTFPPLILKADPSKFHGAKPYPGQTPESNRKIALTDGGVYDNLGLEPVWKTHRTLLVSDAGKPFSFDGDPGVKLSARLLRVFDVSGNQIGALRTRWLIDRFNTPASGMVGTYFGIATEVNDYRQPSIGGPGTPTAAPPDLPGFRGESLRLLRAVRTDLNQFSDTEIACLENHAYALTDAALRRYCPDLIAKDAPFKWPDSNYVSDAAIAAALKNSAQPDILHDLWDSVKG